MSQYTNKHISQQIFKEEKTKQINKNKQTVDSHSYDQSFIIVFLAVGGWVCLSITFCLSLVVSSLF